MQVLFKICTSWIFIYSLQNQNLISDFSSMIICLFIAQNLYTNLKNFKWALLTFIGSLYAIYVKSDLDLTIAL